MGFDGVWSSTSLPPGFNHSSDHEFHFQREWDSSFIPPCRCSIKPLWSCSCPYSEYNRFPLFLGEWNMADTLHLSRSCGISYSVDRKIILRDSHTWWDGSRGWSGTDTVNILCFWCRFSRISALRLIGADTLWKVRVHSPYLSLDAHIGIILQAHSILHLWSTAWHVSRLQYSSSLPSCRQATCIPCCHIILSTPYIPHSTPYWQNPSFIEEEAILRPSSSIELWRAPSHRMRSGRIESSVCGARSSRETTGERIAWWRWEQPTKFDRGALEGSRYTYNGTITNPWNMGFRGYTFSSRPVRPSQPNSEA